METDSQMKNRMTVSGTWEVRGRGIQQKGKRTREHGQQCDGCCGEGHISKQNGNRKNTTKVKPEIKNLQQADIPLYAHEKKSKAIYLSRWQNVKCSKCLYYKYQGYK